MTTFRIMVIKTTFFPLEEKEEKTKKEPLVFTILENDKDSVVLQSLGTLASRNWPGWGCDLLSECVVFTWK